MKASQKNDVIWLRRHFKPVVDFVIGRYWFGIMEQYNKDFDAYAVKIVDLYKCDRSPDDGAWLKSCGGTRWDTESGAAYAILHYLNEGPAASR